MKLKSYGNVEIVNYPFHEDLKAETENFFKGDIDKQRRTTNVKASMTEWMWGDDFPQVRKLKKFIISKCFEHFSQYYVAVQATSTTGFRLHDFWANVYRKGDYTRTHSHLPYRVSCVYFYTGEFGQSPLLFNDSKKLIFPKEGRLVFFESHLLHCVPRQLLTDKPRITFSGNLALESDNK